RQSRRADVPHPNALPTNGRGKNPGSFAALRMTQKSSNRALRVLRVNSGRIPRRCRFILTLGAEPFLSEAEGGHPCKPTVGFALQLCRYLRIVGFHYFKTHHVRTPRFAR